LDAFWHREWSNAGMSNLQQETPQRVVIASANPLFGKGLEKLIKQRWVDTPVEIRMVSSMADTLQILERWQPDLVVVDYDDRTIDRQEFLNYFVSGDQPMQVMLVSLQASGAVVVYDRKSLSPDEMEDWLSPALKTAPVPTVDQQAVVENKTENRKRGNMKHFVIVGVLVIISTVLVNLLLNSIGLLPAAASTQAGTIDRLFSTHFFLISFLFSLITVFLVYSIVVFRKRAGEPDDGAHITGSHRLEIAWTLIPLATVLYISYIGSQSLAETRRVDPQAMVVNVTAGQWFWSYEYPDYGITSPSLYLPIDRQVLLRLSSLDVIHSFWVPEFRVKQDVLPGENLVKELRFTPTIVGEYVNRCAEMCGGAHAYMNSPVIVLEQSDFDAWLDEQSGQVTQDPAVLGQRVSEQTGCIGCHTIDGANSVGPTWAGLYGSQRELTDGTTLVADEEYLYIGIVDPNQHVPVGYPANVMPKNYDELLTDQQISNIIAYIRSLE
jgi:cytochrome c oxidase subunit II